MTGGVNGVALAVFALFFLLVTVADSLAARWHKADDEHSINCV